MRGLFDTFRRFLPHRFDSGPISSVNELAGFVETRSAYVAQTSLYGYLKTRMGTRYTELFQDDVFVVSINKAKWEVYGACLSDLTVFSVGFCGGDGRLSDEQCASLAQQMFLDVVGRAFKGEDARGPAQAVRSAFQQRLTMVDWSAAGGGENAFDQSPVELVRAAPVTEQFKTEDREIIMNSIRFRWRDVREQLRKRAAVDAVAEDWKSRN